MTAADNKDLVRRLVDHVVNSRDPEVLDEIADGEIAAAARRWTGPFRESFPDFIHIFRIENGRLTGATATVEDTLTRMKQLGFEL